jgi:apolipoprotein D and lipocalin family protein
MKVHPMSDRIYLLRTLAVAAMLTLCGCASMSGSSSAPLRPVKYVDLQRYMGGWFVIANIPYFAEKDCFDSVEGYALRADGRIDNKFACREKSFDAPMTPKLKTIATVHDRTSNAEWRVPFFRVVRVKYFVIDLDPDYRWAVIGHPSRRYGWILSRTRTLPDDTYLGILQRLRGQGYDEAKFVKVPHRGGEQRTSAGAVVPVFRPVVAR